MRGHDDAATTRRRRRQPRCRCSPGSQSLQPPRSQSLQCPGRHRSFRRRYSPSLAAAPSLQVPAAALPHGPHCSPDPRGWVVEARTTTRRRRRDDQHWWSERTVTSLFGAESGDGGPDGGPLGAVRAGRCFLDWLDVGLWADIAGQAGAVPTVRRLQAAARGAGRLRRGAGAPHVRVAAAPDLAGGFLHELTENQRSDQKIFPFLEWLRVGEAEQVELRDAVQGAQEFPRRGAGHVPGDLPRSQDRHQRSRRRGVARDAVVLEQALYVEVWEVGSGFCWTTARASRERSCSATRGCATRSPTPACWGSRCAGGSGSATPTTRIFR